TTSTRLLMRSRLSMYSWASSTTTSLLNVRPLELLEAQVFCHGMPVSLRSSIAASRRGSPGPEYALNPRNHCIQTRRTQITAQGTELEIEMHEECVQESPISEFSQQVASDSEAEISA